MSDLETILNEYKKENRDYPQTARAIEELFFKDLGHTTVDTHRQARTGSPEVVFCKEKSAEQIMEILSYLRQAGTDTLATRLSGEKYAGISDSFPEGKYYPGSGVFMMQFSERTVSSKGYIAVVSAGTSDDSVAEEAALTASFYGHRTLRINDVGVAGIHRLLNRLPEIQEARVVIVVAGMEGALASVVGGLVKAPVIAVPTSVGYGASFGGLSALLGMLTSCASGVAAVNIDNGFGAGQLAARINSL